jgi:tRNA A37 threonylcarbamoyladenosine biosynthesis protein TsaE
MQWVRRYMMMACCSREYIRFALGKEDMDVPSPTYLLHNTYTHPNGVDIHHYDLYRLQGKSEMEYSRLDLNHSLETGVCLIEWPEKLIEMGVVPKERLELHLSHMDEDQDQDDDEDSKRLIHLNWFGERWGQLVLTLAEHVQDRGSSLGLEMAS